MKQIMNELIIKTYGEGFIDITSQINSWIAKEQIKNGILLVFCKHTSCSLIINENADRNVLKDLNNYFKAIVPEWKFQKIDGSKKETKYLHNEEGPDDMPAHIKTILTSTSLSLSVINAKLILGTWQTIYLWEHRINGKLRKLNLHLIGD